MARASTDRAIKRGLRAPDGRYWLPVVPDGYFEVAYPNGNVQAALVEIDMGTLTLRRFRCKVQAFAGRSRTSRRAAA